MNELKKDIRRMVVIAGVVIAVLLVLRYWPWFEKLLSKGIGAATPLLLGCAMAYVINILMSFYERLYERLWKGVVPSKIRRIVCMILAFVTLIGIIVLIVNLVLPELINCIASFIRLIPGAVAMVVEYLDDKPVLEYFPFLENGFDINAISSEIETLLKSVMNGFSSALGSILTALTSMVSLGATIMIGSIFSVYVLLDKEKLGAQCKTIISTYLPKPANKIFYFVKALDESFHSFIVGQCTEAVILGLLCIAGMLLLGFPYAVMIGVFIGFTALIPIAGAYIGASVGAIMILTESPLMAIEFIVFIVILQQLEGNLIYPRVVGKSIGLPGIFVLIAITIGGGVLGIGGMLVAVPLFATFYRLIKEDIMRRNPEALEQEQKESKEAKEDTKEDTKEEGK